MVATEILRAAFRKGSNPQELLRIPNALSTFGKTFSGFVSGKGNMLRAFLDWETMEAHHAFHATDAFPPFLEDFQRKVTGEPALWHVDFKPSLEAQHRAQSSPVTEVTTLYFAGPPPLGFVDTALGFREVPAQQPGFVDLALGETHEEVTFDGVKGYPIVLVVGWESEEQ